VAAEEINYRRFFDINDMAAIRVELPEVFHATHDLLLRLLAEDRATGVRVDHPDGLWAPTAYFRTLQQEYLARRIEALCDGGAQPEEEAARRLAAEIARPRSAAVEWPLYVVAEKILSGDEPLPQDWAVYGTTGYDFLGLVNGLFVDTSEGERVDRIYRQFTGMQTSF